MRVLIPGARPLRFEQPVRVIRAHSADEVDAALAALQDALSDGSYCAGYLSYELGAHFAARATRANRTLPLLALGVFNAPDAVLPIPSGEFRLGALRARVSRAQYDVALRQIAQAIYNGDVYQINYTVPFDFAFDGEPYALFAELIRASHVGYGAYVEDGDVALASISPELFFEINDGIISAKPMKGTAPLEQIEDLSEPKNRAEHLMIVDLLRNDLHRICTSADVPALYDIERYPTFATMTSTVRGHLREGTQVSDILRATFPCGSVTGAPKRAAMDLIETLEPDARDAYTGSIGYFAPDGSARWNVAIRTLQINRKRMQGRLDIGGGIVADSKSADEWDEITLKGRFVEPFIRPFALLETCASQAPADQLDAHLERLAGSAGFFNIPLDVAALRSQIESHAREPGSIVRLRVDWTGEISLRHEAASTPAVPVKLTMVRRAIRSTEAMLAHKTSWRDGYDRAYARAVAAGCFDALCTNERDELTEGTRTSLFVEIDDILYTPPRSCGLLPGILRERLLAQGRCRERVLYEEDLRHAARFYVGNSARGLLLAQLAKELTGV